MPGLVKHAYAGGHDVLIRLIHKHFTPVNLVLSEEIDMRLMFNRLHGTNPLGCLKLILDMDYEIILLRDPSTVHDFMAPVAEQSWFNIAGVSP